MSAARGKIAASPQSLLAPRPFLAFQSLRGLFWVIWHNETNKNKLKAQKSISKLSPTPPTPTWSHPLENVVKSWSGEKIKCYAFAACSFPALLLSPTLNQVPFVWNITHNPPLTVSETNASSCQPPSSLEKKFLEGSNCCILLPCYCCS